MRAPFYRAHSCLEKKMRAILSTFRYTEHCIQ